MQVKPRDSELMQKSPRRTFGLRSKSVIVGRPLTPLKDHSQVQGPVSPLSKLFEISRYITKERKSRVEAKDIGFTSPRFVVPQMPVLGYKNYALRLRN